MKIQQNQPKAWVITYRNLQQYLNTFLSILGIMVGLLTLATGALRSALISYDIPEGEFSSLLVVSYGLFYTALVAMIYIPVFLALRKAGRDICDKCYPMPDPFSPGLSDWSEKRKILEDTLQLNVSMQDRLKSNVYIFAPLLSGIASIIFD